MITNFNQQLELDESEKEDFLKYMNRKIMYKNESDKIDSNLSNGAYIKPLHTFSSSHLWMKRNILVSSDSQEIVYISGCNLIIETQAPISQRIINLKSHSEVTSLYQSSSGKGRHIIVGEKVSDKDNYYSYSHYGRVEIFNIDKLNTNEERRFLDHSYYINYPHFIYDAIGIKQTDYCLSIVKNLDTDESDTKVFLWDFDTISMLAIHDFENHIENIVNNPDNKWEYIFHALFYFGLFEYSPIKNKFISLIESCMDNNEISDCAFIKFGKLNGIIVAYNTQTIEIYDRNNENKLFKAFNFNDVYSFLHIDLKDLSFFKRVASLKKQDNKEEQEEGNEVRRVSGRLYRQISEDSITETKLNTAELVRNSTFTFNHDKDTLLKNYKLNESENRIKYVIVRQEYIFVFFVNTSVYFTLKIEYLNNPVEGHPTTENMVGVENPEHIQDDTANDNLRIILVKIDRLSHDVVDYSSLIINETLTDLILITGETYKTQFMLRFQNVKKNIFKQQKKDKKLGKEEKRRGDHTQLRVKKMFYRYKINKKSSEEIPTITFDSILLRGSSSGQEIRNIAVSENPRFIITAYHKRYVTVHQQFGQNEVNTYEFVQNIKNLLTNYDINPNVSTYNTIKDSSKFSFVNEKVLEGEAISITINPHGNHFFISYSGMASLFSVMENEIKETAKIKTQSTAAAFSNSGNYLAFSWEEYEGDYSIVIIDINTHEVEYMIKKIPMPIKIMWLEDDRKIVALFNDTSTNIVGWTLGDKRIIPFVLKETFRDYADLDKKKYFKKEMIFKLSDRPEKIIDFVYDTVFDYLLISTEDKRIKIFRPQIKDDVYLEFGLDCKYTVVLLIRKLDIIIFGTSLGSIRILLWPISNYTLLQQIDHPEYTEKFLHSDRISSLYVSSDLQFLYSGSADGSVFISTLHPINNDSHVNIQTFVIFNSQNILPRKMHMDFSDFIHLTDGVYKSKIELIEKRETELHTIDSEFNQEMEKIQSQNSKKVENKRNEINKEIETKRRTVKNLEDMKESKSKLLKEKRENQFKIFKQEIKQIKNQFKSEKESLQQKTKHLNSIIKETNTNFTNAITEIDNRIKIDNEEKIMRRLESQYQDLLEKFNKIEKLITEKKKNFKSELGTLENTFEEKIRKQESEIRTEKTEHEMKMSELEIEISKTRKYNKNYNDKINEWETHLVELNNNTADLTEIYLFNLLKLRQMYSSLKENEKKISENEATAKQKRSVNDRLEQLRYVLEYQIKNLIKEKSPIEEQIKNFEILHSDFYKRFNLLYSEQLKIDEFITNNDQLITEFKKELGKKKCVLYTLKNVFSAVDIEIHNIFKDQLTNKEDMLRRLKEIYDFYLKRDYANEDSEAFITEEKKLHSKFIEREINKQKNKVLKNLINSRQKIKEVTKQKEDIMLKIRLENQNLIDECSNIRTNLEDILKHITDIEKKFIELTNTHLFLNKNINTKLIKKNFKMAKQSIMLGDAEKTKIVKGNVKDKDDIKKSRCKL